MWEYKTIYDIYVTEDKFLEHSRTKGSKNGIRRYQNADGTWTPLGLIRRREREGFGDGKDKNAAPKKMSLKDRITKAKEDRKKKAEAEEVEKKRKEILEKKESEELAKKQREADEKKKAEELTAKKEKLLKSVDSAYSAVYNLSMGKALAKRMGLDTAAAKAFDLEDFVKNIDKKSNKEIQDIQSRLSNQEKILKTYNKMQKEAEQASQEKPKSKGLFGGKKTIKEAANSPTASKGKDTSESILDKIGNEKLKK